MAGFKQTLKDLDAKLMLTFDGDDFDPVSRLLTNPPDIIDESGYGNFGEMRFDENTTAYPGYRMGMPSQVTIEPSEQYSINFGYYGYQAGLGGWAKAMIDVPHNASFAFPEFGSFTVAMMHRRDNNEQLYRNWQQANGITWTNVLNRPIMRKGSAFNMRYVDPWNTGDRIDIDHPGGTLSWVIPSNIDFYGVDNFLVFVWEVKPDPSAMYRGVAKLYFNGRQMVEQVFTYYDEHPVSNVAAPWEIGGYSTPAGANHDDRNTSSVQIDQVSVFGKALTSDEIAWLWRKTRPYTDMLRTTVGARNIWTLFDEESIVDTTIAPLLGTIAGQYQGGPTRIVRRRPGPPRVPGSMSAAFQDNGIASINNYVSGRYAPVLSTTDDFAVEFSFRASQSSRGVILSMQQDTYPYTGISLQINWRNNQFMDGALQLNFSDSHIINSLQSIDSGAFRANNGDWYHVVIMRRNGVGELWVNGILHGSVPIPTDAIAGAGPGQIYLMGMSPGKLNVDGNMSLLSIYSAALSPSEIRARASYSLTYRIQGTITLMGAPYRANVRVYRHRDGELVTETLSNANSGTYQAVLFDNSLVDVVALSADDPNVRMRAFGPITPAAFVDTGF